MFFMKTSVTTVAEDHLTALVVDSILPTLAAAEEKK